MTKKMVKMSFRVKVVDFSIYLNILRLIIGTKIKDILMALEDDIEISCSVMTNKPECRNLNGCATRDILDKIQIRIDQVLDSVTLADM